MFPLRAFLSVGKFPRPSSVIKLATVSESHCSLGRSRSAGCLQAGGRSGESWTRHLAPPPCSVGTWTWLSRPAPSRGTWPWPLASPCAACRGLAGRGESRQPRRSSQAPPLASLLRAHRILPRTRTHTHPTNPCFHGGPADEEPSRLHPARVQDH